MKTTNKKTGPTVDNYRDYKNFSEQIFKRELKEELDSIKITDLDYSTFQNCFEKVLYIHEPMKKKYARFNDGPSLGRVFRKATMLRSRLKNKYDKSRTAEHWETFIGSATCVLNYLEEKKTFLQKFEYF